MKILLLLCALGGVARATDLPCGPAEAGTVSIDGLTDDWSDVDGIDAGGWDANASFTAKCNVTDKLLYLLVDVRDQYFVRTPKAAPGEDHLELELGGRRLTIHPGDAAKIPNRVLEGKKPAKGVQLASALQQKGWAVELAVPLAQIPGWRKGAPSLKLGLAFADCDSKSSLAVEKKVDLDGNILFAEAESVLDGFLKEKRLDRGAIWWDRPMALGKKSGARVLFIGKYLVFVSDGYLYLELPFRERKDLRDARMADLAGDGRDALVVRYVEYGGGGSREVLAVFRPVGDSQVQRVFAVELAKSAGPNKIENKLSFVKRGKATDLLVEAGSAVGFSAANYKEAPAADMVPILLPWSDERRAKYQFVGDEYRRGD